MHNAATRQPEVGKGGAEDAQADKQVTGPLPALAARVHHRVFARTAGGFDARAPDALQQGVAAPKVSQRLVKGGALEEFLFQETNGGGGRIDMDLKETRALRLHGEELLGAASSNVMIHKTGRRAAQRRPGSHAPEAQFLTAAELDHRAGGEIEEKTRPRQANFTQVIAPPDALGRHLPAFEISQEKSDGGIVRVGGEMAGEHAAPDQAGGDQARWHRSNHRGFHRADGG